MDFVDAETRADALSAIALVEKLGESLISPDEIVGLEG